MHSIHTVTTAKKRPILTALLLLACVTSGCASKDQAANRYGSEAQQKLEGGDVAGARLAIAKAIRERDDLVELHLLSARIELAGHSLEAAFLSYYNALSLDPVNQDALQAVAMLGLQTGHTNEAESAAGRLLSLAPGQPTALLVKGLLALERRRYPEALAEADGILANVPSDENAVILKARALFLSGSPDQAKQLVSKSIELTGETAGLARISLEMGRALSDGPAMLKALSKLQQLGQVDIRLTLDEANVRYKLGDRAGAAKLVLDGLTQSKYPPDQVLQLLDLWREYDSTAPIRGTVPPLPNGAVREGLARFMLERGRPAEAGAILTGLDTSDAAGIRSRFLLETGQVAAAKQLANQVVELDPSQCDAQITIARLSLKSGDIAAAVTRGQQAAAECPTVPDGWLVTSEAYEKGQQPGQAARVYRDAIVKDPDDLRLHSAFIAWLVRAGRRPETVGVAKHLIRSTPNRSSSWRLLAEACIDDVCRDEATKGLKKAETSFVIDRRPGEVPSRGLMATLNRNADEQ